MEVLVAVLVLGIGLLGVAALQARSMQFNHDAYLRSQATIIAQDIVDRMRMHRGTSGNLYTAGDPGGTCGLAASSLTDASSKRASVTNDLNCWFDELGARLPGGTGAIVRDATDTTLYTITVSWLDREQSAEAGTETFKDQVWTIVLD